MQCRKIVTVITKHLFMNKKSQRQLEMNELEKKDYKHLHDWFERDSINKIFCLSKQSKERKMLKTFQQRYSTRLFKLTVFNSIECKAIKNILTDEIHILISESHVIMEGYRQCLLDTATIWYFLVSSILHSE